MRALALAIDGHDSGRLGRNPLPLDRIHLFTCERALEIALERIVGRRKVPLR